MPPLATPCWRLHTPTVSILRVRDLHCFAQRFPAHFGPKLTALSCTDSFAGACGGETACSTCHVIVDPAFFKKLPEMSEAEEDMLDLAAGLTEHSRLGCQVFAAAELDGLIVNLPKEVNNMMSK
jgi:ferredoxin